MGGNIDIAPWTIKVILWGPHPLWYQGQGRPGHRGHHQRLLQPLLLQGEPGAGRALPSDTVANLPTDLAASCVSPTSQRQGAQLLPPTAVCSRCNLRARAGPLRPRFSSGSHNRGLRRAKEPEPCASGTHASWRRTPVLPDFRSSHSHRRPGRRLYPPAHGPLRSYTRKNWLVRQLGVRRSTNGHPRTSWVSALRWKMTADWAKRRFRAVESSLFRRG